MRFVSREGAGCNGVQPSATECNRVQPSATGAPNEPYLSSIGVPAGIRVVREAIRPMLVALPRLYITDARDRFSLASAWLEADS